MAELPAGVQEIGRIPGDNGGEWVLGSDGAVYAIGGATYLGGYNNLENMGFGPQDPNRQWEGIYSNDKGGYILKEKGGGSATYEFNAKIPEKPVADDPVLNTAPQIDPNAPEPLDTTSGSAIVKSALKEYNLEGLGDKLLDYMRGEGKGSVEATKLFMRQQPEYKSRFKGMELRNKAGYDPISEEAYVKWEGQTRSLFDHYGIPKSFYDDQDELDAFIGGDVSVDELKERIVKGYMAVHSSPPETINALQQMYGAGPGEMAAFFLDPTKGEEIITQRWTAAQIGGKATKSGFGNLTSAEGEALATAGLTGEKAGEAFSTLQQQTQLTQGMTREERLAAAGGDATVNKRIEDEALKKKARFGGGGDFATGQGGVSGLGTAND